MDHFAGLDVSVKEISVCIVDDAGRIASSGDWRGYWITSRASAEDFPWSLKRVLHVSFPRPV